MISMNDVEALIELIEWYRDDYHKSTDFCNEMISNLQKDPVRYYEIYDRCVDDWFDY